MVAQYQVELKLSVDITMSCRLSKLGSNNGRSPMDQLSNSGRTTPRARAFLHRLGRNTICISNAGPGGVWLDLPDS